MPPLPQSNHPDAENYNFYDNIYQVHAKIPTLETLISLSD